MTEAGPGTVSDIPPGFAPHTRKSGLTDPWEPIFAQHAEGAVILAIRAAAAHCNSRGFVHGGLISAIADNAMGLSIAESVSAKDGSPPRGLVTVSLSIDFLSPAKLGQWLEFRTGFTRIGNTLCFAQCFVAADETVCARASGTFHRVAGQQP